MLRGHHRLFVGTNYTKAYALIPFDLEISQHTSDLQPALKLFGQSQ